MPTHESYKNAAGELIDFELSVLTRPNLRDREFTSYCGKPYIENIFDDLIIDNKLTDIYIEYPERWCNLCEQRALLTRIPLLYPNIKKVKILTHSVYIIQCANREQVIIYDNPDIYPEKDYSDVNIRFCPQRDKNVGLQVFGL